MVITRITSGLGNQLFQYALGRQIANQNQTQLWFDLRYYRHLYETDTPRYFKLDRFAIDYKVLDNSPWRYLSTVMQLMPVRNLEPLFAIQHERHFHVDPMVSQRKGAFIKLSGFWQSETYFAPSESIIRNELTFNRTAGPRFGEYRRQIGQATIAISVHVRRGDYISHPDFSQSFGTTEIAYYEAAVSRLAAQFPAGKLFIFSDDPAWVQQHMRFDLPHVVIDNSGEDADLDDLELMSLCHHHIIANSSFSWWGAWLNSNPTKCVIAPKQWFADKPWDTRDLTPANWLRL